MIIFMAIKVTDPLAFSLRALSRRLEVNEDANSNYTHIFYAGENFVQ